MWGGAGGPFPGVHVTGHGLIGASWALSIVGNRGSSPVSSLRAERHLPSPQTVRIGAGRCFLPEPPLPMPPPPGSIRQKLLLSELDMKKLRDTVQHLQNELIRVSWGREHGERGWESVEKCRRAEGRRAWREGSQHSGELSRGAGVSPLGQGYHQALLPPACPRPPPSEE